VRAALDFPPKPAPWRTCPWIATGSSRPCPGKNLPCGPPRAGTQLLTSVAFRTLATATFGISLAVHTGLLPGWWFVWAPRLLWMFPPQIWRFATAFLITGPNLGLLFDTYFLYSYLSQLEIGNPRFPRKEDLIWYLMFVGGTIMVSSQCLRTASSSSICASVFPYLPNPSYACSFCFVQKNPSYICPDSVMPLLLSRFLEMRKSTPALRAGPSFANQGWCRGVGMVGCLMDGSCDSQFTRVVFIAPYISSPLAHLVTTAHAHVALS